MATNPQSAFPTMTAAESTAAPPGRVSPGMVYHSIAPPSGLFRDGPRPQLKFCMHIFAPLQFLIILLCSLAIVTRLLANTSFWGHYTLVFILVILVAVLHVVEYVVRTGQNDEHGCSFRLGPFLCSCSSTRDGDENGGNLPKPPSYLVKLALMAFHFILGSIFLANAIVVITMWTACQQHLLRAAHVLYILAGSMELLYAVSSLIVLLMPKKYETLSIQVFCAEDCPDEPKERIALPRDPPRSDQHVSIAA